MRVRVTEDKIQGKSKENQLWFELAQGLSSWESAVYMYSPHYSPYICSGVPRNILPHPIKGLRKIPKRRGVLKESMVLKRNF